MPKPTRSLTKKQFSRSKLELYLECPRCFYDDIALGLGRPSGPSFTLNIAVDALMKAEFDAHRAAGTPHPLFATVRLEAVPFRHPDLDRWRTNFTGVRWKDPETGWTFYGAVDDLWVKPDQSLIVADYKATAKADEVNADKYLPRLPAAARDVPVPGGETGIRGRPGRVAGLCERHQGSGGVLGHPVFSDKDDFPRRRPDLGRANFSGGGSTVGVANTAAGGGDL